MLPAPVWRPGLWSQRGSCWEARTQLIIAAPSLVLTSQAEPLPPEETRPRWGGARTRPASREARVCTEPAVRGAWSLYQNHRAPGPWPQTRLQAGFTLAAGQG